MILADEPLDTLEKKDQWMDTPRGIGTMRKILEAQHLCKTFNGKAVLKKISSQVILLPSLVFLRYSITICSFSSSI